MQAFLYISTYLSLLTRDKQSLLWNTTYLVPTKNGVWQQWLHNFRGPDAILAPKWCPCARCRNLTFLRRCAFCTCQKLNIKKAILPKLSSHTNLPLFYVPAFEKVIEGSCSKLRTRIRLIDSRNKLKKDELRKNEYSVDEGRKTIIELTGLAWWVGRRDWYSSYSNFDGYLLQYTILTGKLYCFIQGNLLRYCSTSLQDQAKGQC